MKLGGWSLPTKTGCLRFGAELIFAICEAHKVEAVILHQGEEQDLFLLRFGESRAGPVATGVWLRALRFRGGSGLECREKS